MADIIACPGCGQNNRLRPSSRGGPRCGACQRALPWLVETDEKGFDGETSSSLPVLVDFWAPWCGPCRMIAPVLQQLSGELAGRLKVVKVNVDENPALASRFQAMSIPLLVLIKEGVEQDRIVGMLPKPQLMARLSSHLGPA